MVIAGSDSAVIMVESEAKELSEDQMLGGILFAQQEMQGVIEASITPCISCWANRIPPNIWSSDNSLASDSTIITAESLPAITISKSDPSNSLRVGLMQY